MPGGAWGREDLADTQKPAQMGFAEAPAAPGRILSSHLVDQVANLEVESRAADRAPLGLPSPIELEALTVPGEDGRRLDDDETRAPSRPPAGEPGPEDPVPT
jgi:hypothetical protein